KGSFDVSGSLDLSDLTKPDYDLTVIGSNLPVKYDLGDIECLIEDVDLTVTGSDPPVATGDVDITQFLYQEPFFEDIESDALEAADTVEAFDYNIHISIPRNMWIKNEDTDVELKGDLIVLKEGKLENFLGTLEIVRGKFYLTSFNRTFDFEPGGIIRFDNIEKFNPLLEDIRMWTTIRDSSGTREISLQISDSLENPSIDVPPGSDYTLEEVWVFMNPIGSGFAEPGPTDTIGNGARSSIGDRLTVGATGIALNQASRYISRRLGVETFELTTSAYGRTFNPLETELTIGFYTTPRLYIYGASQLSFSKAEEFGFDYRLSKRVFISGRRDRKNLFELDLNLNWEFK
ncbi:MAG: translocation/assembly module TamB domain-containing protein, partial [candidate division Zixibacteria bacterium]|nr:translocation/assembly module TamB domain-containing protein [candidate division Zixibacteria bacterium]